jgi:hypothetical protein
MITPFESRWSGLHPAFTNDPERFETVDGSLTTWSRAITRAEELPAECAALLPGRFETFPYAVHTPAMGAHEPESFLFLGGPRLVVVKRTQAGLSVFQTELDAITVLETETVLLSSSLTFHTVDGRTEGVPFNSVVEDLFAPVVAAYLQARGGDLDPAAQVRAIHPDPFEDLIARDDKYQACPASFTPGARPRGRFYHPTEVVHGLFNGSRLIPSYLLVASGDMLCSFSEKAPFRDLDKTGYGLVVRYFPLTEAFSVGQRPLKGSSRYRMLVLQAGPAVFEHPVASGSEPALRTFLEALQLPDEEADEQDVKVG